MSMTIAAVENPTVRSIQTACRMDQTKVLMPNRASYRLFAALPPAIIDEIQRHLSRRELQAAEALLASFSPGQLTTFTVLLQRLRQGLASASSSLDSESGEDVFSSRDPLTSLMMRADGVTEEDLRMILESVRLACGFKSSREPHRPQALTTEG